MKHELHKCNDENCQACEGGLSWCKICNGAEGSLPTHCPGRKMTEFEEKSVYNQQLDYKDDKWIEIVTDTL